MTIWDGVHAGLEAATLLRATQAQQTLAAMKATADNEAARRALIEQMKNYIFNLSQNIQAHKEDLETYPQPAFIYLSTLDHQLYNSGLSPSVFPDINDKQFFVYTQKKLNEAIDKSRESLTKEQEELCGKALKYIREMPFLDAVIETLCAKEAMKETNVEWVKLSARQSKKGLFKALGIAGILATFLLACPLSCFGLFGLGASNDPNAPAGATFASLLIIAFAAVFPIATVALFVVASKSNTGYQSLKAKRDEWQTKLVNQEDYKDAQSIFGDLSSEKCKSLSSQRHAFIESALGSPELTQLVLGIEPIN